MIARDRGRGMNLSENEAEEVDAAIAFAISNGISSYHLSKRLGITSTALCLRAKKLGLRFHSSSFWSEGEIEELRELLLTHSIPKAAEILGRTEGQVRGQAKYRRIPYGDARFSAFRQREADA